MPGKDKVKILLLEGISPQAEKTFEDAGYKQVRSVRRSLNGSALEAALEDIQILGVRSRTQLTADVLASAGNLLAVGCFSVGTNQVDLPAARACGIPVFNAPFSNTRSVAELVIGEIVMLLRRAFDRSIGLHGGLWNKSAERS